MRLKNFKMLAIVALVTGVGFFWFYSNAVASSCHSSSDSCGTHSGDDNSPADNHGSHNTSNSEQGLGTCSEIPQDYRFLSNMPIFLDSPEAIYAKGNELNLTQDQIAKIAAICRQARKDAVAVLTADQKAKLGKITDQPITFAKICPMMKSEAEFFSKPAQAKVETAQAKAAEQTVCPVMGGEIDKKISTTYKGKKVYFCCPGCIDKFNKDPGAYTGKLPQFAK